MRLPFSVHDAAHVGLRRGIRAAIAVPVATVIAFQVLGMVGAMYASMGSFALLVMGDFGGNVRGRLIAYLGTTAVVIGFLVGAVYVDQHFALAVASVFVVSGALAYAAVLRGYIAAAAPVILLMFMVATTTRPETSEIPEILQGWLIGAGIATLVANTVLPRRPPDRILIGIQQVLRACSASTIDRAAIHKALSTLQAAYFGNPFRAAGLSHRNRALIRLAAKTQQLATSVLEYDSLETEHPSPGLQTTSHLHGLVKSTLASCADSLDGNGIPSAQPVTSMWAGQWDDATDLVASHPHDAAQSVAVLRGAFPARLLAIEAVRIVELVREVVGADVETLIGRRGIPPQPVLPKRTAWTDLRTQATLKSPWMRTAIRTAIALSIAVGIVLEVNLQHGFWVVLGVTATLRMDATATRKSAALAFAGTMIGVALGFAILFSAAQYPWLLIIIFPAVAFGAGWAPVSLGFAPGQAAMSLFVLTIFTILTWPPTTLTAEYRVIDISVGVLVSIGIATVMWPSGILPTITGSLAESAKLTSTYLASAIDQLTGVRTAGNDPAAASTSVNAATEIIDLALSPQASPSSNSLQWRQVLNDVGVLLTAGHLLFWWAEDAQSMSSVVPAVVPAVDGARLDMLSAWVAAATHIEGNRPVAVPAASSFPEIAELSISSRTEADRLVAAVWTIEWARMADGLARLAAGGAVSR